MFEHPHDLIHSRVCNGLAIRDWPRYLAQAFAALKPGGWVEAQEVSVEVCDDGNTLPPNSMIVRWHEEVSRAFRASGADLRISGEVLRGQMRDAGFVNVVVHEYRWPMGPWHEDPRLKEAGAFAAMSMIADMESISLAGMTRYGGWQAEEIKVFLEKVRQEWKTKGLRTYWPLFVVYGQKPEERQGDDE